MSQVSIPYTCPLTFLSGMFVHCSVSILHRPDTLLGPGELVASVMCLACLLSPGNLFDLTLAAAFLILSSIPFFFFLSCRSFSSISFIILAPAYLLKCGFFSKPQLSKCCRLLVVEDEAEGGVEGAATGAGPSKFTVQSLPLL